MKVIVCNTHEVKGGAAKAAQRISKSLTLHGVENSFLSLEGGYAHREKNFFFRNSKFLWSRLEGYQKLLKTGRVSEPFSVSKLSLNFLKDVEKYEPDIINLHYINNGLFSIKDIGSFKQKVVWTLHDAWAFTGGCHLTLECERYKAKCGNCPVFGSKKEKDLSREIWKLKSENWAKDNFVLVSPSRWLAECAKESSLFQGSRVEVIPNPLDTSVFKMWEKDASKKKLDLEKDKRYILFGAVNAIDDVNKGFHFLKEALVDLNYTDVELLVFGASENLDIPVNIPVRNLGFIHEEEELAKVYSASDVTVIPSISENHPNLAIESLACGTPVVGFDILGLREIVKDERFGLLGKSFSTQSLRKCIKKVLSSDSIPREDISTEIREKYSMEAVGNKYKKLFESLMSETWEK